MAGPVPSRPARIDPLAGEILEALRARPEAGQIVLGGYIALQHYLDYRPTHDIDAWWREGRKENALRAIRDAMAEVARRRGLDLRERAWGETSSFELIEAGTKIFSFQIAERSIELEPPHAGIWDPIGVESVADNVGAKMNALVQRGAARDFLDMKEIVTRGLASVEECWRWWIAKNPGLDAEQARAQALHHLEALEQRRPLKAIPDPEERSRADETRRWVRTSLLGVPDGPRP